MIQPTSDLELMARAAERGTPLHRGQLNGSVAKLAQRWRDYVCSEEEQPLEHPALTVYAAISTGQGTFEEAVRQAAPVDWYRVDRMPSQSSDHYGLEHYIINRVQNNGSRLSHFGGIMRITEGDVEVYIACLETARSKDPEVSEFEVAIVRRDRDEFTFHTSKYRFDIHHETNNSQNHLRALMAMNRIWSHATSHRESLFSMAASEYLNQVNEEYGINALNQGAPLAHQSTAPQ